MVRNKINRLYQDNFDNVYEKIIMFCENKSYPTDVIRYRNFLFTIKIIPYNISTTGEIYIKLCSDELNENFYFTGSCIIYGQYK